MQHFFLKNQSSCISCKLSVQIACVCVCVRACVCTCVCCACLMVAFGVMCGMCDRCDRYVWYVMLDGALEKPGHGTMEKKNKQ